MATDTSSDRQARPFDEADPVYSTSHDLEAIPAWVEADVRLFLRELTRTSAAQRVALVWRAGSRLTCVGCTFDACPPQAQLDDLFEGRSASSHEVILPIDLETMPGQGRVWLVGLRRRLDSETEGRVLFLARNAIRIASAARSMLRDSRDSDLGRLLSDLIRTILQPGPVEDLLAALAETVAKAQACLTVSIDLFDSRGRRIQRNLYIDPLWPDSAQLAASWRNLAGVLEGRGDLIAPAILADWRQPRVIPNIQQSGLRQSVSSDELKLYLDAGISTAVICPLWVRDDFLGLMSIAHSHVQNYGPEEVLVLERIADVVATGVKVVQLFRDLSDSQEGERVGFAESIQRLAAAAEARDYVTSAHLSRLQAYSYAIARRIGEAESTSEGIAAASALHDIGKIGLPDSILLKPGPLTKEQRAVMERHTIEGERLLVGRYLETARKVARHHHERWDGMGYPDGLRGLEIPLAARIVSVADVYDALVTVRPYKPAWEPDQAIAYVRSGAETAFDPDILRAFLDLFDAGQFNFASEAAQ